MGVPAGPLLTKISPTGDTRDHTSGNGPRACRASARHRQAQRAADRQLRRQGEIRPTVAGQVLFSEGARSNDFFVIMSGRIRVVDHKAGVSRDSPAGGVRGAPGFRTHGSARRATRSPRTVLARRGLTSDDTPIVGMRSSNVHTVISDDHGNCDVAGQLSREGSLLVRRRRQRSARQSERTCLTTLRPGMPVTPPPPWVAEPA